MSTGSHNHRDRHTCADRRVQFPKRHRLVWQCLPPHLLLFMPLPRPCLHLLPSEVRLCHSHRGLRDRISGLRCRTEFHRFYHWSRHRRLGRSRNDVWRHGLDDQCSTSREETGMDGCCRCHDGDRKCGWPFAWRSFDD